MNQNKNKNKLVKRITALVIAMFIVMAGLVVVSTGATVTKNVASWSELEAAVESVDSGGTGIINITKQVTATSAIRIENDKNITIVCNVSGHEYNDVDIARSKDYHGNFFIVKDGATLNVQCCMSGRAFTSGNWRGIFTTTNSNTVSTGSGYYGEAMIYNQGEVNLVGAKAVLKHNYNPYTDKATENGYEAPFHRSSGNDTVSAGWSSKQVVYPVLANSEGSHNEKTDSMKGGAIYSKNGYVKMKKDDTGSPLIYDCIAEYGGAICFDSLYSGDDLLIEEGIIKNCVARQRGGAICSMINTIDSSSSTGQATWKNFVIGKTGADNGAVLIQNNIAPWGGGIFTNIKIDLVSGTIQNNQATGRFADAKGSGTDGLKLLSRGGGIYYTGHDADSDYGQPTNVISGGVIKGNKADVGGGVYVSATVSAVEMTGGEIIGNQAGVLSQGVLSEYRVKRNGALYPVDTS